ncbi:MAG: hypothetical protein WC284_16050 [Candidimonas sp.]
MYEEYVFDDYLISPINGHKCKRLLAMNIKVFGFSSLDELDKEYPGFPRYCNSSWKKLLERIEKNKEYKKCDNCGKRILITSHKRHMKKCLYNAKCKNESCTNIINSPYNKFCSNSCSASFNNKNRKHSDKTKEKIAKSLKKEKKYKNFQCIVCNDNFLSYKSRYTCSKKCLNILNKNSNLYDRTNMNKIYTTLILLTCKICNKKFYKQSKSKRSTCSRECYILSITNNKKYQNGSRKNIYYFSKSENKTICLESSWELKTAQILDQLEISWIRPSPIKWIDGKNISHYYYPDFYLPDYNVYLDPKNPYCMELDKEKISVVSKEINLIYGDIAIILNYINDL